LTIAEARTVAFMDLGTNSIRLLLVRIQPDYSYAVLTQLRQMVHLREGAFTHQYLQPEAIDRAVFVA
jgi:exopolyphosphatase / guanosine-5'-triphosphate,3'-diphosphate pyrophosphatase